MKFFPSLRSTRRRSGRQQEAGEREPAIRSGPVRHAVGMDLSDASVEAVAVERQRDGRLALRSFNRIDLPEGIVRNAEIIEPKVLANSLRELFRGGRPEPFPSRFVILSLPESKVYLHTFEFPKTLSAEQVRSAIRFEAEGALPLALEEVYADALIHRSRESHHHVLFAAVSRRLIDTYVAVLREADLHPVAVDVESMTLASSLVGSLDDPVIVADIGANITTVSIVERGAVHGASTMDIAGRAFTALIAQALGLPVAEAESVKLSQGISESAPEAVRVALRSSLEKIVGEIQRTAKYHESHTGRPVAALVLAGGSAFLRGLPEFLEARTGLPVRLGDPLATLQIVLPSRLSAENREALSRSQALLAPSFGLAVRAATGEPASDGINLLPDHLKRSYLLWRENLAISLGSVLTAGILLVFLALFGGRAVQLSLRARDQGSGQLRDPSALLGPRVQEAVQTARSVTDEVALLAQFEHQRGNAAGVFQQVRAAFTEGVQVTSLTLDAAPRPENVTVKLRGTAATRDRFLAFEERLRKLEGLVKLDSPLSNLDQPVGGTFMVDLTIAS